MKALKIFFMNTQKTSLYVKASAAELSQELQGIYLVRYFSCLGCSTLTHVCILNIAIVSMFLHFKVPPHKSTCVLGAEVCGEHGFLV